MVLVGLMLLLAGNRMPKLRQNSLAGLRTKETLSDEKVWFQAQRFAGKCYVAGGAAMVLAVSCRAGGRCTQQLPSLQW